MTRYILTFAIVLATAVAPRAALADDKPPTAEQMEQAKAAYTAGKALHDQGKLPEAIEKFKESYRLSKRPVLLYNIAFTMDEAKQDLALFYYQKYLKDAPATDGNRAAATERVKVLEQQKLDASLAGGTDATPPPDATKPDPTPAKPPVDTAPKLAIKPAGTYKADDFQHQIVEEAPPGKPLDVSASVPQDSGWTVTLFYRAAGEGTWTAKPMKWRYKELVARIPAAKMAGSAIQYYVEVKDQTGEVVTRAGKSTSPNLVNLDASATARFYPDLNDDKEPSTATEKKHQDNDNPLGDAKHAEEPVQPTPEPGGSTATGTGFRDVGSKKFEYAKWAATGLTVALFATSIGTYVAAGNNATALKNDTAVDTNNKPCTAPCRPYDSFDSGLQSSGKRDQTIANVTFGVGVAGVVVAGYFWYRELTGRHKGTETAPAGGASEPSVMIGPTVGDGMAGAAAIGRF